MLKNRSWLSVQNTDSGGKYERICNVCVVPANRPHIVTGGEDCERIVPPKANLEVGVVPGRDGLRATVTSIVSDVPLRATIRISTWVWRSTMDGPLDWTGYC